MSSVQIRESLAVKYRPSTLQQLIGQETLVDQVRGLLRNKAGLPSTILITGSTGCGKTTVARILAQYINCEHFDLETLLPCMACEVCKGVEEDGVYEGVEEINFSDSRGIDTVREVIKKTNYMPRTNAHVFILDEMHNMTPVGQNALLKTLEEPPVGSVFILLTTDPQKLIEPLKNRCVQLTVKRVPENALALHLKRIAEKENREYFASIENGLAIYKTLAVLSKGVVRQAVALLESVMASIEGGKEPSELLSKEILVEALAQQGGAPALEGNFAELLIGGVYSGRYSQALSKAKAIFGNLDKGLVPSYVDRMIELHMQTLYVLVDPNNSNSLSDPYYNDWKATLIREVREGNLRINHSAAGEIIQHLLDFRAKIGTYEFNHNHLLTAVIVKLVDIVRSYAALKDSPLYLHYGKVERSNA